jgi:hypothetical protein
MIITIRLFFLDFDHGKINEYQIPGFLNNQWLINTDMGENFGME